jgi:hypothetical protein
MTRPSSSRRRHTRKRVFRGTDFHSGDGFLTHVWGPAQWHVMHTLSFNYPLHPTRAQQRQYRAYVLSLQHVLPCRACRDNLRRNLADWPLTAAHLRSRDSFSRYMVELHERVNRMLGKPSGLTFEEIRERYEHFRARCLVPTESSSPTSPESGCTEPLHGNKARCILSIVPQTQRGPSLRIDKSCLCRRSRRTRRR